jgi:TetR/AcrR family transcriptional regulator
MDQSKNMALPDTRIQTRNRQVILDAALAVFSDAGFKGATVDRIAARARMSKPNLLYYFRRKEDIYVALLEHTLDDWLEPFKMLDAAGEPLEELRRYIQAKLRMSQANPQASRLFANEILHGAPMIGRMLGGPLKALVDEKARIIEGWVQAGKLAPVDPYHLIFAIWAVTQHYADFSVQVSAVLGRDEPEELTEKAVLDILLRGLKPSPPASAAS